MTWSEAPSHTFSFSSSAMLSSGLVDGSGGFLPHFLPRGSRGFATLILESSTGLTGVSLVGVTSSDLSEPIKTGDKNMVGYFGLRLHRYIYISFSGQKSLGTTAVCDYFLTSLCLCGSQEVQLQCVQVCWSHLKQKQN